jgi:CheY-like chemotaxis protein
MEGLDGFEICRQLKADPLTREIPVVFMTSLTEASARTKAFRVGGFDYIVKPFEPEEIVARVRTQLALRSMTKSLREQNARLEQQIQERLAAEAAREHLTEQLRQVNEQLSCELKERERAEAARSALQAQLLASHQQLRRELSTPLIPITDKIMIMPLIGTMSADRARQVIETALDGAAQRRAAFVILDVTGIKDSDAQIAGLLVRAGRALSLLGARVIVTGIGPEMARMLVDFNAPLDTMVTKTALQDGVAHVLHVSGKGGFSAR